MSNEIIMTETLYNNLDALLDHKVVVDKDYKLIGGPEIEYSDYRSETKIKFDGYSTVEAFLDSVRSIVSKLKTEIRLLLKNPQIENPVSFLEDIISSFKIKSHANISDCIKNFYEEFTTKDIDPLEHPNIDFTWKSGYFEYPHLDREGVTTQREDYDINSYKEKDIEAIKQQIQPYLERKFKAIKKFTTWLERERDKCDTQKRIIHKTPLTCDKEQVFLFTLFSILKHGEYIQSSKNKLKINDYANYLEGFISIRQKDNSDKYDNSSYNKFLTLSQYFENIKATEHIILDYIKGKKIDLEKKKTIEPKKSGYLYLILARHLKKVLQLSQQELEDEWDNTNE